MTPKVSILRDRPQAGGAHWVTYQVIYSAPHVEQIGPVRVSPGIDLKARGQELAERHWPRFIESDLERAIDAITTGQASPSVVDLRYNPREALFRELVKRLFNLMRADSDRSDRHQLVLDVLPLAEQFNDAQVAALLGDADWTVSAVSDARARLLAFAAGATALDHGRGEVA